MSTSAESRNFDDALGSARVKEAAHFEAALDIRDAQTLRLQVLKDELAPIVASKRDAQDFFALALVPGDPPRLWLDLISSVVMAPNPRTYRLIEDTDRGREILLETTDRAQMLERIREHMAHRTVARARLMARPAPSALRGGYSTGALVFAWLSGFLAGALVLFVTGVLLAKLSS
jgi:hypothetical protein